MSLLLRKEKYAVFFPGVYITLSSTHKITLNSLANTFFLQRLLYLSTVWWHWNLVINKAAARMMTGLLQCSPMVYACQHIASLSSPSAVMRSIMRGRTCIWQGGKRCTADSPCGTSHYSHHPLSHGIIINLHWATGLSGWQAKWQRRQREWITMSSNVALKRDSMEFNSRLRNRWLLTFKWDNEQKNNKGLQSWGH